jgi:UDP-N-acetylmuramyl pentapeptide synthase
MELGTLTKGMGMKMQTGDPATEITGLGHDSRVVSPGDLFFALKGERADGHALAMPSSARPFGAVRERW